jgi:hypothetical protein
MTHDCLLHFDDPVRQGRRGRRQTTPFGFDCPSTTHSMRAPILPVGVSLMLQRRRCRLFLFLPHVRNTCNKKQIKIRPALQHRPLKKFSTEATEGSAANERAQYPISSTNEDEKTAIPRQASHVPIAAIAGPSRLEFMVRAELRAHGISKTMRCKIFSAALAQVDDAGGNESFTAPRSQCCTEYHYPATLTIDTAELSSGLP